jgi:DHA1 family bicyclomycin/chloramphenicol resistance-like MFS transporter
MSVRTIEAAPAADRPIRFGEFIAIIALAMSLSALSIDNLLPAFPWIGAALSVQPANQLQLLVFVFMAGFAAMQPVYGPAADVLGRRPVLLAGLAIYALASLLAIFADSFGVLLAARALQGVGVASARVVTISVVRDRFAGREMARVMSFIMMVFIIVPIFAPAIGSAFLLIGGWRLIFVTMLAMALAMIAWIQLRLPETLRPEHRLPFSAGRIGRALQVTVTTRSSVGYATAIGLMLGNLMSYLGSSQQIFQTEVYGLGLWFAAAFSGIAAVMGLASFANSRLVRRLGMRRLSHAGVCGAAVLAVLLLAASLASGGKPPFWLFVLLLAGSMFLLGLTLPNFNAMAMEPLGAVAGTAASMLGFYTTLMGVAIGSVVGQAFDGTVTPLAIGFLTCNLAALPVILWAERGRLFAPHHPDHP